MKSASGSITITESPQLDSGEISTSQNGLVEFTILDSVAAEIAVLDRNGVIVAVNEPWRRFSLENGLEPGKPAPNTGVGANYLAVCQIDDCTTSEGGADVRDGILRVMNGELARFSVEYPCHSPTQERWFTMVAMPFGRESITGVVVTHTDITQVKQAQNKINELAFFDQLTGLPNRALLLDRLERARTTNARSGGIGALIFINLNKFMSFNNAHGHGIGNCLLKQMAQRLMESVRAGDTVARLGSDEFAVMLTSLNENESTAATQTEAMGNKILAAIGQSYQLGDFSYHCTASMGATLFRDDVGSVDGLLKQAYLAVHRAKEAGRGAMRFFDPIMETAVMERAALETGLREAIQQKQFLLHYQPQIVGEGRVVGAEVLLRWQHPQRGLVLPSEFIPLAEETGLILPLGEWVLDTACAQLAIWAERADWVGLTISVNVSAHQFCQANFVDHVVAILQKNGTNPRQLKLELTESLLAENVEDMIEKMFALKAKGVSFSLDDFGTGYSSLSYLKRLPLDQLKIDQSFVRDVLSDPNDAAIAKTVVALAQSLGLGLVKK
jgi:diguanylate cyclase (GGDEF)-like protein